MRVVYEESSKFNPSIKECLNRLGAVSIEVEDMLEDDYLLIDGMRHYIILDKKRKLLPNKYLFIDSGYFGNFGRSVGYIRIVPNSMHPKNLEVPEGDIIKFLGEYDLKYETKYLPMLNAKPNFINSNTALIIPPSRKYCRIDNIKQDAWIDIVKNKTIGKMFDNFYVRKKSSSRADRMVSNPIWDDIEGKRALICHSSITSIDAMLYGIPFVDLGDGPVVHLSYSQKELKKGFLHTQETVIETFNKLMFYQCSIKGFEDKLLEIMDFHKSL